MKISDIEIRICRHNSTMGEDQLKGKKSDLEYLVIQLLTDEGIAGHSGYTVGWITGG